MSQQIAQRYDLIAQHAHVSAQVAAGERNRHRRNTEREAFHCRGNRSGIKHILAHVLAMIDSTENEIGPVWHQRFDG